MSVHAFHHEAMAAAWEARIDEEDAAGAAGAAEEAFAELARIEAALSRFMEGGDVWRVSRAQAGDRVRVGEHAWECLRLAERFRMETGGAFDAGYRGAGMAGAPGAQRLEFLEGLEIGVVRGPMEWDLGAVGKGYALDVMGRLLRDWGYPRALLVAGGSSVLALDPPTGADGWPVRLGDAEEDEFRLVNRAVSGSGAAVKGAHIIHPGDGRGVAREGRVWTAAGTGAESDAFSTGLYLMEESARAAWLAGHPEVGGAWLSGGRLVKMGRW